MSFRGDIQNKDILKNPANCFDGMEKRKIYAIVWIGDQPGIRVTLMVSGTSEAKQLLEEKYEKGHVISIRDPIAEKKLR